MTAEILAEITATQNELIQLISSLNEQQLNTVPFAGSWTAGQLAEHLIKSDSGIVKTLHGATQPSGRRGDEKIKTTREIFLDFSKKFKAPEFIIPSDTPKEKERVVLKLTSLTNAVSEAIKTLDLSELCKDFALPGQGEFTRLEWCYFMLYHTQRHINQLKNIVQKLAESDSPK